jgi:hypothetical protein
MVSFDTFVSVRATMPEARDRERRSRDRVEQVSCSTAASDPDIVSKRAIRMGGRARQRPLAVSTS